MAEILTLASIQGANAGLDGVAGADHRLPLRGETHEPPDRRNVHRCVKRNIFAREDLAQTPGAATRQTKGRPSMQRTKEWGDWQLRRAYFRQPTIDTLTGVFALSHSPVK